MIPHHFHQPPQVHRFYEYDQGYNQHQTFDQTHDIDLQVPETHAPPDHEHIEQNDYASVNINHQPMEINTAPAGQTVGHEEYDVLDNHSNCVPYDPPLGNHDEGPIGEMHVGQEEEIIQEKDEQPKRTKITAEQAWNDKFEELRAFHAENGHSDVPQTYKKNKPLGKWVGKQREHYKTYLEIQKLTESSLGRIEEDERRITITGTGKKKSCPLTQDRISKLCSLDFKFAIGKGQYSVFHGTFTSSDTLIKAWEDKFKMLERYKRLYGNLNVPTRPLMENHCGVLENHTGNASENGLSGLVGNNDKNESSSTMTNFPGGDTNAPLTENQIKSLGRWLISQKKKYRDTKKDIVVSSQVLKDRFRRLSELGVNLESCATEKCVQATGLMLIDQEHANSSMHGNTTRYNSLWETRYKQLVTFKEEKGHMEVRANENKTLYDWIHRQRSLFRDYMEGNTKSRHSMTNGRIAQLEKIGFDWKYNFEVVDRETVKAAVANATVGTQKRKRRKKSNEEELDNVEISIKSGSAENALQGKDTCYDANTKDGRKRFRPNAESLLKVNYNETMTCNSDGLSSKVSDHCIDNETEITSPIINELYSGQKSIGQHKKGTKPQLWGQHYDELVKFHSINGHCRVPGKYNPNPKLGYWVKLQREDYKHLKEGKPSPMNDHRIHLLEKIGFQFRVVPYSERQNAWNVKFDELKAYKSIHGNCDVPQAYKANPALGKWVSKQRDAYRDFHSGKQRRITQEKINNLESIGFRFFIGKGKAIRHWDHFFTDLVTFKEKFGHTNIPLSYNADPQLGRWAYFQRVNNMKKVEGKGLPIIVKKRLDQLKDIGFRFHFEKSRCVKRRGRPKNVSFDF